MVARSYCLFNQSEGFSGLFGQLIILHVFIERSIYGKPEAGGAIDEESDIHEFGGGAKCSQFLICQQRLTQPNVLKGIHRQRGKKEINAALGNRCLLCFCLTDKYTEIACLIKLPSLEGVLERLALLTEPLVT